MFDKFEQFTDVLKLLLRIDPADLTPLLSAAKAIIETDDLRAQVQKALVIADIVTNYVPGELDDQIVDALQVLARGEHIWALIATMQSLITDSTVITTNGGVPEAVLAVLPEGLTAEEVNALPWPGILQVGALLFKTISALRKDA